MRLPEVLFGGCAGCPTRFTRFEAVSPPLTLVPAGRLAAYHRADLQSGNSNQPIPVLSQKHEGAIFVVTFASGSVVRISRMHAAN